MKSVVVCYRGSHHEVFFPDHLIIGIIKYVSY